MERAEHKTGQHPVDLLPFYVSGALEPADRKRVGAHLEQCATCQEEVLFWGEVAQVVQEADAAVPLPSLRVPEPETARVAPTGLGHHLRRAFQILWAQVLVLDRRLWLASALAVGAGLVLAIAGYQDASDRWVEMVSPLVAALGIAFMEHPRQDPAWELVLASPLSPRTLILARAALIFGFNLVVAMMVTLALGGSPWGLLERVVFEWLAPMTCLSALALLLAVVQGPEVGASVAFLLWGVAQRWIGLTIPIWPQLADALRAAITGPWAWATGAALLGAALWLAGREEFQTTGLP